jgi:hypothetical protein
MVLTQLSLFLSFYLVSVKVWWVSPAHAGIGVLVQKSIDVRVYVAMGLDWTISLIPLLGILSSYRTWARLGQI